MAITVSNVSVAQGTGTFVKESVLEVTFTLALDGTNAGHLCTAEAQFQIAGAMAGWGTAILHSFTSTGQSVRFDDIGNGTWKFLIRVPLSLAASNVAPSNWSNALAVQVRVKDKATNELSAYAANAAAITLKAARPTIASAQLPQYIGNIGTPVPCNAVPITLTGSNQAPSPGNPLYYRYSKTVSDLDDGAPLAFRTFANIASEPMNVASEPDGALSILVKVYDQYYNASLAGEFTYDGTAGHRPWLQKTAPAKRKLRIVGSTGREEYTGLTVNADGSFTPNRKATLFVSADSPLPMTYKVLSTSNVETGRRLFESPTHALYNDPLNGLDKAVPYSPQNSTPTVYLTTDPLFPSANDYNTDASVQVHVEITDAAGNKASGGELSKAIRLNTRVYRTAHTPLRKPDALYRHALREVSGSTEIEIPQSPPLDGNAQSVRSWNDIFYPPAHSFPVDEFGNFDETTAVNMNGNNTSKFDAVTLEPVSSGSGSMKASLDEEGRPLIPNWTRDGTKNYGPMLSSDQTAYMFWVIDNTGHGDYRLEFEWFDLNPNAFGPPYNPLSPYRCDVLVAYDASAPGALNSDIDPVTGKRLYTINDPSLMKEIAAWTGSGVNVMDRTTGARSNSNDKGGFKTDWFRNRPVVCLVLYTDAAGSGSGFRLKSGPRRQEQWLNWHVDEQKGEFWVHKHAAIASVVGAADSTQKKLIYQYMDRDVKIDLDQGVVEFAEDPAGEVRVDYSYYDSDTFPVNTLLAGQDDFVEYQPANAFVGQPGEYQLSDATRSEVYEDTDNDHGRVTTRIVFDKDRGILEFPTQAEMPVGRRVFADYYHHTFKRLSNDGFNDPNQNSGDLTFRDPIIVPDTTASFRDYTFSDIMIVNEGDATLEKGVLRFTARGYDTDGQDGVVLVPGSLPNYPNRSDIKDQVLDINRPWDVQKGTSEETFQRMACAVYNNFIWPASCPKTQQEGMNNPDLYAVGILGQWADGQRQMPDLAARGRLFGRAVWVLGGTSGNNYPQKTTAGTKRCSVELEGDYYTNLIR